MPTTSGRSKRSPRPEGAPRRRGGRLSPYRPEFAEEARELYARGFTDAELAAHFGVVENTLRAWKTAHSEFRAAVRVGKDAADDLVEDSLFRLATGGDGIAPNVAACIFWLKNRRPQLWRDRAQHEVSGPEGGPIRSESTMSDREAARIIARFLLTADAVDAVQTTEALADAGPGRDEESV